MWCTLLKVILLLWFTLSDLYFSQVFAAVVVVAAVAVVFAVVSI